MILTCERCGKPTDNIHNAMTKCMQCGLRLCDSCAQWTLIDAKWTTCDVCGDVNVCKQCAELVNRETFASGAVRDTVDYRYDLMSPLACDYFMQTIARVSPTSRENELIERLLRPDTSTKELLECLQCLVIAKQSANGFISLFGMLHLYAQALHEGASKYGERNWEQGIPESNLINHALAHLFKLAEGDTSENHLSHLVWNVLTIIHFRELNLNPERTTL